MWTQFNEFPDYEITPDGRIRRQDDKQEFSLTNFDKDGYVKIALRKNGKRYYRRMHQLVAMQFIPNPEQKPIINHLNGIKHDNRVENLEWATYSENVQHGFDCLGRKGHDGGMSKPIMQIDIETKQVIAEYDSAAQAARMLEREANGIYQAAAGRNKTAYGYIWKWKE